MATGYDIKITDTTTGETRTYHNETDWDDVSEFDWFENNRSCDCNRGLYFEYAIGKTWETAGDFECGDVRFKVVCFDMNGNILAADDD